MKRAKLEENDASKDDALVASLETLMDEMDTIDSEQRQPDQPASESVKASASGSSTDQVPAAETIEKQETEKTSTATGFEDNAPIKVEIPTEGKSIHLLVEAVKKHDLFAQFCESTNVKPFGADPVDLVDIYTVLSQFDCFLQANGSTLLDESLMKNAKHSPDLREAALEKLQTIAECCKSSTLWTQYINVMAAKEGITASEEIDEFKMAWCSDEIPHQDQCRHIHEYLNYVICSGNDHGYNINIIIDILNIDLTKTESLFQSDAVANDTPGIADATDAKDMDETNNVEKTGDGNTIETTGDGNETDETEGESDLHFRYPPAPSTDHPSIKCILGSAAKAGNKTVKLRRLRLRLIPGLHDTRLKLKTTTNTT